MHERTISAESAFAGRLLNVEVLQVELETGQNSRREIVRHPGASVVLAQRTDGPFVFVRQFRKPIESCLLEIVAGTLVPGEDPAECARRELIEETGHEPLELTHLGVVYPAPGYTDGRLNTYFARVNPEQGPRNLDDDERIEIEYLEESTVDTLIAEGKIEDAKTLSAWMLYKARRMQNG